MSELPIGLEIVDAAGHNEESDYCDLCGHRENLTGAVVVRFGSNMPIRFITICSLCHQTLVGLENRLRIVARRDLHIEVTTDEELLLTLSTRRTIVPLPESEREVLRRGGLDLDTRPDPDWVERNHQKIAEDERRLAELIEDGDVPGLQRVLEALPKDYHPAEVYGWLTTPDVDLGGRTVLDWLRQRRSVRRIVEIARDAEWDL